ncbi:MAG: chloride channel protein [Dehalococcoidia bacterium]|nr:chloride channel protein [Dehalococcoidia bacterium]
MAIEETADDQFFAGVGHIPGMFRRLAAGIGANEAEGRLGDFTTTPRVITISALAIGIGVFSAFVALALLRLIGLFTNLFFFHRINTTVSPIANNDIGPFVLVVPVIGGIVVGFMARYGSDKIRGHGIPEAIEAILMNGSRVQPRVAFWKPLSSAIAIGSGGPFGAEGPIIMTGGAFGSIFAQFLHLTSAERKTLLVAGAAAGMSATFAAPVASVLLAVELLLFEWKPRSLIPVALASGVAALIRHDLLGAAPIFPVPEHAAFIGVVGLLGCVVIGLSAGVASLAMTEAVYAMEDAFHRLPIHWMWWPAIGGLAVGIAGLFFPEALGVGYNNIGDLLGGDTSMRLIIGVLLVKSVIWAVALGSGTSGGVLAPLLMVGCALGGLEAHILPAEGAGFWSLIAMGAILGGTMRAPLTGVVFALELTHDVNAMLPLLVAVMIAHGFTVLTLQRSILTEKISRRGYHIGSEYAVDPLEITLVKEVMRTNIAAFPATTTIGELGQSLRSDHQRTGQRLYPVVDNDGRLCGVISRTHLQLLVDQSKNGDAARPVGGVLEGQPIVAFPDEPLRTVVYRMAETGITRMPVVSRQDHCELHGMVALTDLLKARGRTLNEERQRERVLRTRMFLPARQTVRS